MRGRTEREHPSPVPPYIFENVPLLQRTLALFEWEVQNLQCRAKELSIDFKAKPSYIFWDDLAKTPLVLQWNLDHDNCPFLSTENLCKVHDQKPLICQAYPLMASGLMNIEDQKKGLFLLDCPNVAPLPFEMERMIKVVPSKFFRETFNIYGNTFAASLRFDALGVLIDQFLTDLTREWIIHPAIIDKEVEQSILKEKPKGLLEHLESKCPSRVEDFKRDIDSLSMIDETFRNMFSSNTK
jgi:Fe-S-cluster containining protein